MKKSLIYTTILTAATLGAASAIIATNAEAERPVDSTAQPLVTLAADLVKTDTTLLATNDQTVYVIADAAGTAEKTYFGSVLNTNSETLPFTLQINYYLDGTAVSAKDLAGKSGHVKMVFNYDSTIYYSGKKVPFLAIGGTTLNNEKFTNLTVQNAKLIDDGSRLAVVGYAVAGASADLKTDLLPTSFTIEADVTNFELPVTYSFLTNNLFAEIDTSELKDADSLISSINQLASGLDQLIAGAGDLSNGLNTLVTQSAALKTGAEQLSTGLTELTTYNDTLNTSAATIYETLKMIPGMPEQLLQNYQVFATYLENYTAGVANAAAGAEQLAENLPALIAGETELYNGSVTLLNGLNTFKSDGINKLVSFANKDLEGFLSDFRATVNAAKSYTAHTNFIVKTAAIK